MPTRKKTAVTNRGATRGTAKPSRTAMTRGKGQRTSSRVQPRQQKEPARVQTRPVAPAVVAPSSPAPPPRSRRIYLLSDSTGNLGKHMMAALLTQFPPGTFDVLPIGFLEDEAHIDRAFSGIAERRGIVLHSVVAPAHKASIVERAARLGLPQLDLTGGIVEFLSAASGVAPTPNRGRLHEVNAAYQKRIGAIEFVLTHDDGLGMETLVEADIILAGVSRTSKTPTSIYLAQQGYKVANVALAIEAGVPDRLLAAPKGKVVGLVIDPRRLSEIRMNRQTGWRMGLTSYSDQEHVRREVEWSRQLFSRQGWPMVNVTNQAIEETAARIIEVLGLSHQPLSS